MIRTIGKWLIDRAAQRDASLPSWLQRWIDRDAELSRFDEASRRLAPLLRNDAAEWMARHEGDGGVEVRTSATVRIAKTRAATKSRRATWAAAAFALAASALLALAWRQSPDQEAPSPPTSIDNALATERTTPTISPSDSQQLIAVWHAGRADVGAWQARLKDASRRFEAIDLRRHSALFPAVEFTTDAPQRISRAFSSAVKSQQQDVTAGMKSAYAFFTHRLPASVALLVGLQDG